MPLAFNTDKYKTHYSDGELEMNRLTILAVALFILSAVGCCSPMLQRPLFQGGLFNCLPCNGYQGGVIVEDSSTPVPADTVPGS